jgi:type I restriction enzyme S subunit
MEVNTGKFAIEFDEFPEGWKIYTFGQVFQFLNTGSNSRKELSEFGEYKYVHYGDIHTKWSTFLDVNAQELPSIDKDKVSHLPKVAEGDLIIADASEDYEGIGKAVEVRNVGEKDIVEG